jgi:flagellar biosynthetic protein FliQ
MTFAEVPMEKAALLLFAAALKTAMVIALPIVALVAVVGVLVGTVQTIVQIQDQNVSFAPKLLIVAFVFAAGGPEALALLERLLSMVIASLPQLVRT